MSTILEGKLYLSRAIFKKHYTTNSLFCVSVWYLVWFYLGVSFPYSLNPCRRCNFGLEVDQYSTDGLSDGVNGYAGDSFSVPASDALLETAVSRQQ